MSTYVTPRFRRARGATLGLLLGACCLALLAAAPAPAAELPGLEVLNAQTGTPVTAYRWLVEQDKTYHVQTLPSGAADPNSFDPNWDQGNDGHPGGETLAVSFHQSYMPVAGKGCVDFDDVGCNEVAPALLPNTHYYVSVVPRSGYSIGGAGFVTDGDGNVPPTTVYVNQHPIPTAQISILIFHDNAPINNAPDLPSEDPANDADGDGVPDNPMSGFQIIVEDAGGRYGAWKRSGVPATATTLEQLLFAAIDSGAMLPASDRQILNIVKAAPETVSDEAV